MELVTSPSAPASGPWRKDPSLQEMAPEMGTAWALVPTGPCLGKEVQAKAEGWPRSTWWRVHEPPSWLSFLLGQHCLKGAISASTISEEEMLLAKFTPPDPRNLPICASSFSGAGLSTPSNMTSQGVSASHSCSNKVVWISQCLRWGGWKRTLTATAKLPAQYIECFKTNFLL